ncbi:DNA ligase-1 [Methanococcus maripaludis]|uniref:DNA ligase-1 n=1 Tax=Methanococcus maripaludis TaxID=39152 RepID=A0A7J9NVI5_METMI|nr:hypothetical protein [Methanococcus maripaludis]MBA2851688.1 DNA ligase-1 [Methanococcus maripaludis]
MTNDIQKFKELHAKISEIRATSSTNAKKAIIEKYKDDELFAKVLQYTYNIHMKFYMKKLPEPVIFEEFSIEELFNHLDYLNTKGSASKHDKMRLAAIAGETPEIIDIVTCILKKDIRANISSKIVSPYVDLPLGKTIQLAEPQSKLDKFKKKFDTVGIQYKLDGVRNVCTIKDGVLTHVSRKGLPYQCFDDELLRTKITEFAQPLIDKYGPVILDGEMVAILPDKFGSTLQELMTFVQRKSGEGTVKVEHLRYCVYDIMMDDLTQEERWKVLSECVDNDVVLVLPHYIDSSANLLKYRDEALAAGYEGIVAKNLKGLYHGKRTIDWIKYKRFDTIDVTVIDVVEGEGKCKGSMGTLTIELPTGVTQDLGTGFTDDFRMKCWTNPSEIIGKVIEVEHQGYSNEGKLVFASFEKIRNDK